MKRGGDGVLLCPPPYEGQEDSDRQTERSGLIAYWICWDLCDPDRLLDPEQLVSLSPPPFQRARKFSSLTGWVHPEKAGATPRSCHGAGMLIIRRA